MAVGGKGRKQFNDTFKRPMRARLREMLYGRSLAAIPSDTLRRSLVVVKPTGLPNDLEARLPHYWAKILHNGRGPVSANPSSGGSKFLLFYRNPADDPRLSRGRPRRVSQIRKGNINPKQLRADLKAGKAVLTKNVGPARGRFFFDNFIGMRGFTADVRNMIAFRFQNYSRQIAREASFEAFLDIKVTVRK